MPKVLAIQGKFSGRHSRVILIAAAPLMLKLGWVCCACSWYLQAQRASFSCQCIDWPALPEQLQAFGSPRPYPIRRLALYLDALTRLQQSAELNFVVCVAHLHPSLPYSLQLQYPNWAAWQACGCGGWHWRCAGICCGIRGRRGNSCTSLSSCWGYTVNGGAGDGHTGVVGAEATNRCR